MSKEYYFSKINSDVFVNYPNGGVFTRAANVDNAKHICAELNRLLNLIPAPKYDPCRKFRKGDKVRVVPWNGRKYRDYDHSTELTTGSIGEIWEDEKDVQEEGLVSVIYEGYIRSVPPCYLELVTPVEEVELFYVCENTESKSFEVRRKEDHKVQAAFYYFDKDNTSAKREAAKATLEHCDRLNAAYRKEMEQ